MRKELHGSAWRACIIRVAWVHEDKRTVGSAGADVDVF